MSKIIAHFLHIRKTGGTAVKYALRNVYETEKYILRLHPHDTRLCDIPVGEKAFFFLRDPSTRYVSGFNSRLRRGWPRYNSRWSDGEEVAFRYFTSADELARALFEEGNAKKREEARYAISNIRHINQGYFYWFDSIQYFLSRINDVLFFGFQESLNEDFYKLKDLLGLDSSIGLPQSDFDSHKTPSNYNISLSTKAVKNLKRWYKSDYKFLTFCKNIKV